MDLMGTVHTVTAKRWEHGWELHTDAGVTQSRTLADAPRMARDFLATVNGGEPENYHVDIQYDLGGLEAKVHEAKHDTLKAQQFVSKAATETREVVKELRQRGVSVRDAATILEVSPGRISQLV
jgi:predicted polyphosphate/ATP-dependent NAD kinase